MTKGLPPVFLFPFQFEESVAFFIRLDETHDS
jgi:hypothetical protein